MVAVAEGLELKRSQIETSDSLEGETMNDIEQQILPLRALLATHVAEISALAKILEVLYEEKRLQNSSMPAFRQLFVDLSERDLQAFLIKAENSNPALAAQIQEQIDSRRLKSDSEHPPV